jgi:hypothetical protein
MANTILNVELHENVQNAAGVTRTSSLMI